MIIFFSDSGSNPTRNEEYGPGWGSACSGPLNHFKLTPGEGCIRSPLIIMGPGIRGQRQVNAFSYITDITPTMLEMANLKHPKKYRGREVAPMRGRSILGVLSGDVKEVYSPDEPVGGEMAGGKWLRQMFSTRVVNISEFKSKLSNNSADSQSLRFTPALVAAD